ncbi:ABC transporter substrate-binding protein [Ornithinimicrobium cerasi]|uniref:Amino acid/amide ABC transporter substrate-binding protein, HAAT family n=1 Tax=Ornithinimicrobium cerasi TaxID=2248773 RepID=A0A285VPK4_9MICO|nr:ABC transporter substrate-binding protein [Ornithinimicrobium cerasi]SOC54541.1 amino acid/amide ABC transporter substrate-binding protein, HAAT family [Ornithinimicrobium cerasi]
MIRTSLRPRGSVAARGIAVLAASALVLTACGNGGDDETPAGEDDEQTQEDEAAGTGEAGDRDLTLEIGTVLPQTGALAFLGPPEEAGVLLAEKHINEADLGITVNVTLGDSGDPDNRAYATTVPQLLNAGVHAMVGAASSGVSKLFIDEVVAAERLMISPANTSPDFTTWDDDNLYWRTAPSDLLQGEVLGNLIAQDGVANLGIIYLNDAYGTGLEAVLTETFEAANGTVVASESYNAGDTTFDAQISSVIAQNPDAIVLITFEEVKTIIPAIDAAGFDTTNLYFVDGNIADYSEDFDPGLLEGAKGTQPGPDLGDEFREELNTVWTEAGNPELVDYNYAAESYDAVILAALSALAANAVEGPAMAGKMQEVSGGTGGGEKATDFAAAAQIIIDGGVVDYDGPSGPISFDENGDPTEATIGIFEYDAENSLTRLN